MTQISGNIVFYMYYRSLRFYKCFPRAQEKKSEREKERERERDVKRK